MMSKNEIQGKTTKERRRNPRIDVELWAVEKRENALHYHLIRNISRDGLYINKPLPFRVGSTVHLDVELSRRIGNVSLTGEIVGNYADSDSNIIGAGVKLVEVGQDEQNRIDRFLAGTSNPGA